MMTLNAMEAALPHRFTSDQYHAMARHGIIPPGARVELLDGLIVEKMMIGDRHMSCVDRLTQLLVTRFNSRAHVRVQGAVHLSMLTEPEPDVLVLRKRLDDYAHGPALSEDVLALVEVAESSLRFDREQKLLLYAQHRISDYWIVNLVDDCIEVHRDPHDLGYAMRDVFGREQTVALLRFPDDSLAVNEILPPLKPL